MPQGHRAGPNDDACGTPASGSCTRPGPAERHSTCEVQRAATTVTLPGAMSADWERLYELHALSLVRYLTKLTGDREAATELMQDTFARGLSADIRDPGAARAWLFATATNLAVSLARRRRLLRFLPFSGGETAPRGGFDHEAHQVRAALRSISAEHAATLLLHYDAGFGRAEIAAMHGVSEETVKSRLARGRKSFIAAYRRLERGLRR